MITPPWGQHNPKGKILSSPRNEGFLDWSMLTEVWWVQLWNCTVFSDLPGQQVWIGPEDSQCEGNIGSIAGLKIALGTSRKFIQHPCCFKCLCDFVMEPSITSQNTSTTLICSDWVRMPERKFRITSVHCLSCAQARFPKRVSTSVLACLEEMRSPLHAMSTAMVMEALFSTYRRFQGASFNVNHFTLRFMNCNQFTPDISATMLLQEKLLLRAGAK